MRPTSAPPSTRASFGPGSGLPIDSPIACVSFAIDVASLAPAVLRAVESLDQPLEPLGRGFHAPCRVLGPRRGGLGAQSRRLGPIGGLARVAAPECGCAKDDRNHQDFRGSGAEHRDDR